MRLFVAAVTTALVVAASADAVNGNDPIAAWVTDGTVYAVATTPTEVLVGGDFTQIGRANRDAGEFDTAAGFLLGWRPSAAFYATSCAATADVLYLGGQGSFSVYQ